MTDAKWICEQADFLRSSNAFSNLSDEALFKGLTEMAVAMIAKGGGAGPRAAGTHRSTIEAVPSKVPDFIFELGICSRNQPTKRCRINRKIEDYVNRLRTSSTISDPLQLHLLQWGLGNSIPLDCDDEFMPDTGGRARALGQKVLEATSADKLYEALLSLQKTFGGQEWWDAFVDPTVTAWLKPKLANRREWSAEINYLIDQGILTEEKRGKFAIKPNRTTEPLMMSVASYLVCEQRDSIINQVRAAGKEPIILSPDCKKWRTFETLMDLFDKIGGAGVPTTEAYWNTGKLPEWSTTQLENFAEQWERFVNQLA